MGSGHLRDAEAPIGGSQGLVGHVDVSVHLCGGQLVGAVGREARVVVHPGVRGHIGSGVPLNLHLLGGQCTVPLHAGLDVHMDRRAADRGGKFLVPAVGQFHGPALGGKGQGDGDGLAADLVFAAEPAADLRDRDAHLLQWDMERGGQKPPHAERRLRGAPHTDLPGQR